MKKIVIGITGGIGSGKSTVSEMISKNNFTVLKADDIARQIMSSDSKIKSKIIAEFGDESYFDGKLNAKYLAQKVFNQPEQIRKLNVIVHPPTIDFLIKETKMILQKEDIVFVESALVFEAKMEDMFNYILLITSSEETRIKRVLDRDHVTISDIKSRIVNQIPEDQKRGKSDFIIENNSSIQELETRVIFFLRLFKSLTN